MKRFAFILACLVFAVAVTGCSGSSATVDNRMASDAPSSAQLEASWNSFAAGYDFSSIVHEATFGSMYSGSDFEVDMWRLGMDINDDLDYDTGIQNQGSGVMFCEFTGDGCRPPKK